MNRHERRRAEALGLDREARRSDAMFFARHPERVCRLRRAFPSEREAYALVTAKPIPPCQALFVAVGAEIATNRRVRVFIVAPRDMETDLPEEEVAAYFEAAAGIEWEAV